MAQKCVISFSIQLRSAVSQNRKKASGGIDKTTGRTVKNQVVDGQQEVEKIDEDKKLSQAIDAVNTKEVLALPDDDDKQTPRGSFPCTRRKGVNFYVNSIDINSPFFVFPRYLTLLHFTALTFL